MRLVLATNVRRLPSAWEGFSLFVLGAAAIYLPLWLSGTFTLPLESPLRWFGFACPLCGGSRAVSSLVLGRLELALRYNPLALLMFGAMVYGALSYLLLVLPLGRRVELQATRGQVRWLWAGVLLLFAANWVYVLWARMYLVQMSV